MKKHVLVAMSGGVDSTLTVALLLEQGYKVTGVTLLLFDQAEGMVKEAADCARAFGIPHEILDVRNIFKESVIEPYIKGYQEGMTPNPCMICNKRIKFGLMFEEMLRGGYDYLATGHYAKVTWDKDSGSWELHRSPTYRKDQSYFLHHLSQAQLSRVLFPLGEYKSKDDVRKAAEQRGLREATKKDSDGICFLSGKTHNGFLDEHIGSGPGAIVDMQGQSLGGHAGYYRFTVGQKKGLPPDVPQNWAVLCVVPEENQVIVGPEESLYQQTLWLDEVVLQEGVALPRDIEVRMFCWGYTLKGKAAVADQGQVKVVFDEPVRGIAKGQYGVFFDQDRVLGGGRVIRSL